VQYSFGQFTPEHLEKMREGVELFNEQKYWECHESLEDVWMEDRNDPARNVYWAVIQVAAVCIHYRDSKLIGAQGMIVKAKEKFRRCREQNILTDLAFQYLDWEELEKLSMEIPEKPVLEDFAKLFEFRFKNFPA
jgi:predicted metal-dependent hydrolase